MQSKSTSRAVKACNYGRFVKTECSATQLSAVILNKFNVSIDYCEHVHSSSFRESASFSISFARNADFSLRFVTSSLSTRFLFFLSFVC